MDPDLTPLINQLFQGGLHRNWVTISGFVILLIVHVAKKGGLKDVVAPKYVPVVSVVTGILLSIGDSFIASSTAPWYDTLLKGFIAGASATGLWELGFKHYLRKTEPPTVEPVKGAPAALPAPVPSPADPPSDPPAPSV